MKGFVHHFPLIFLHYNLVVFVKFQSSSSAAVVVANLDKFLSFDGTTVLCTTARKPSDVVQLMLCSPPFVSHFETTFHVPRFDSSRASGGFAVFVILSG